MPAEKKSNIEEVSPKEFQALNRVALEALQGEFGFQIQVRSAKVAINEILKSIDKLTPVDIVAAYDRGFDRTSPGYDRYYDRDRNISSPLDLVSQPPDIVTQPPTITQAGRGQGGSTSAGEG